MNKCPQCGYQEVVDGKPVHSIMHNYIHEKSGEVICLNSKEDKIINAKGTWVREGVKTIVASEAGSLDKKVQVATTTEVKPSPFAHKATTPAPLEGPI